MVSLDGEWFAQHAESTDSVDRNFYAECPEVVRSVLKQFAVCWRSTAECLLEPGQVSSSSN